MPKRNSNGVLFGTRFLQFHFLACWACEHRGYGRAWGPTERKGTDPFVCVWRAAAAWDCRHAGGRGSLRTPPRAYPERRLNASGLLAPTGRTPAGCPCGAARSLAAPSTHRIGAFAGRPPAEQAR